MNTELLQIIIRKVLTALGGYAIGHGMLVAKLANDQFYDLATGIILLIITTFWSKNHYEKVLNTEPPGKPDGQ